MENLKKYAIIVIYPDGTVEKNKLNKYDPHIQYLYALMEKSNRLQEAAKKTNITIPNNYKTLTIPTDALDKKLANVGLVILHNFLIDDETLEDFYVTTPHELTDIQKEILNQIFDGSESYRGIFATIDDDGDLVDIQDEDVNELLGIRTKR